MKYIIEHLEPRLYMWCLIEYRHISKIVGKENLIFTNIKTAKQRKKLYGLGKVYRENVKVLAEITFKRVCLLDAGQKKTLSPNDRFDFLVFGGILGDDPPKKRTMQELGSLKIPRRNIGNKQMPTDNAVYTAKKIMSGTPIDKIKFIDGIEIKLLEGESVIFPFRYVMADGKPLVSSELIQYLKRKKGF